MVLGSKYVISFKEVIIYYSVKMLSSCITVAIVNPDGHSKTSEGNSLYIQ